MLHGDLAVRTLRAVPSFGVALRGFRGRKILPSLVGYFSDVAFFKV